MSKVFEKFENDIEDIVDNEYIKETRFKRDHRLEKFEEEIKELRKFFDYREGEKISQYKNILKEKGFLPEDIDYIYVQAMGMIVDKDKKINKRLKEEWEEMRREGKKQSLNRESTYLDNLLSYLGFILIFFMALAYIDYYFYNGIFEKVYNYFFRSI